MEHHLEPLAGNPAGDPWAGRWSLLHRSGVLGAPATEEELATARARLVLERYGVVTREVVRRETGPFDWAALVGALRRMELRGEVRRGYFVHGFWGVQYAVPEAVERLRAIAGEGGEDAPLIVVNAMDPAQVFGLNTTDGSLPDEDDAPVVDDGAPRFVRVASTHLVFRSGRLLLLAEDNGERVWSPAWSPDDLTRRAVTAYLARPGAARRVLVTRWNDEAALGGRAQTILQPLGFTRAPAGLEYWG
jgi:ATP-dependent Lhr-like helicase